MLERLKTFPPGKAAGVKGSVIHFDYARSRASSVIRSKIAADKAVHVRRRTEAVRRAVYLPLHLHLVNPPWWLSPFRAPLNSSNLTNPRTRVGVVDATVVQPINTRSSQDQLRRFGDQGVGIPADLPGRTRRGAKRAPPICRSRTRRENSLPGINHISRPC